MTAVPREARLGDVLVVTHIVTGTADQVPAGWTLFDCLEPGDAIYRRLEALTHAEQRTRDLEAALRDIVERCGKAFAADGIAYAEKVWPAGPVAVYHAWADGRDVLREARAAIEDQEEKP